MAPAKKPAGYSASTNAFRWSAIASNQMACCGWGGLVDVQVCAIDDTWSGLKFIRRIRDP
jgi:hypothetical protein